MSPFEFISVALSFILGLGVTRLLSSAVLVFRVRRRIGMAWMPLVWASVIFFWQLQYWWAVIELEAIVQTWTVLQFGTLVILALLLFVAGALVLPSTELEEPTTLQEAFERDGRWALLFLATYFGASVWANWYFWGTSVFSLAGGLVVTLALAPLLFLAVRSVLFKRIIVASYVLLSLISGWFFSPTSY